MQRKQAQVRFETFECVNSPKVRQYHTNASSSWARMSHKIPPPAAADGSTTGCFNSCHPQQQQQDAPAAAAA